MKCTISYLFFTLLLVTSTLQAKQTPSADQQIKLYQELRAENYITEQQFQHKTQPLLRQLKQQVSLKGGGSASISGQVFSAGLAVSGVQIYLYNADTRTFIQSQNTDAGGLYDFPNLNPGNYYVLAGDTTDDFIDAIWTSTGTQFCGFCVIPPQGVITLTSAEVSTGHDLHLTVGATLTGQLVDSVTNNPVQTLAVRLAKPGDPSFNGFYDTQLDGTGNYTVSGIPAGTYRVFLEAGYYENLHIPEIYNNIQCNLCSSQAYNGAGTPVTLTNGVTESGIDFSVETGAQIKGLLVDNITLGAFKDWGLVLIFNATNQLITSQIVDGTNQDPAATGAYVVGGLLPGTYFAQGGDRGAEFYTRELYANKPCPWSGCDRGAGGNPINLGPQEQRVGINFILEYGGKISGTVTDFTTGLPIPLLYSSTFQVYDDSEAVIGGGQIDPVTGDFITARAIPAGTYSVRTGSMFNGDFIPDHIMQKYDSAGNIDCPGVTCDLTAVNVTVFEYDPLSGTPDPEGDATTTGIDFALDNGYAFSGTITDLSTSSPLVDVHVLVYDDSGAFAQWATTDASGDFTISGLPAGTYYAKTNNGSNLPFMGLFPTAVGTWVDILYDSLSCPGSACDVTTGTPIVLGASPDAGAKGVPHYTFNLPDGGTFTGRLIHSETSAGVPNTRVNVYNSQSEFFGSYESDIDGYWMTSGFPADTYYLTTQGRGGMVDVKFGGDYCFDGQCDPLTADPIVLGGTYNITNINMILKPDFIFRSGLD